MNGDQTLNIIIKAKDQATDTINKLKGSVDNMQPTFRKMAAVGTAALVGITAAAYKSVTAFAEAEKAQKRMEHILRTATGATDDQILSLNRQADALEKVGVVSADVIRQGQGQLASFDLQAASIEKLIPSVLNYAVAEKGLNMTTSDLQAVTNGLAQALNGNFASLTKTGFVLDDVTKEMLSTGTETERVAALTKVLDSTYAGMNETMRQTTAGGIVGMQMAFGKLQEEIGKALTPVLGKLLTTIEPIIIRFTEWAEANPELLSRIILIGGAVAALVAGVGLLGMALPGIIMGFTLLAGPVGLAMLAIGALTFAMIKANEIFQYTKEDWKMVWVGIKMYFLEGVNFLIGLVEGWANSWVKAVNVIIGALNKIQINIPSWVPGIGGKSFGINLPTVNEITLPRFEQGGIVPGARGTAVPIIAHGGETVVPAGKNKNNGGMNVVFNMNYPQFTSQDNIETVRDQIEEAMRDVIRIYKLQPTS